MADDEKDRKIGEGRTAYVIGEAAGEVAHVHLDVPRHLWERFVRWAEERHLSTSEALLDLIRWHIAPPTPEPTDGFYADLTRRHLEGTLEKSGSILDFRLSEEESAAFAESLRQEYGTDDVVEIIDRLRERGNVGY